MIAFNLPGLDYVVETSRQPSVDGWRVVQFFASFSEADWYIAYRGIKRNWYRIVRMKPEVIITKQPLAP